MMDCQQMNRTIPHLKRNETVLHYITLLLDSAIEFTSQNFNELINSQHFINLDKVFIFSYLICSKSQNKLINLPT